MKVASPQGRTRDRVHSSGKLTLSAADDVISRMLYLDRCYEDDSSLRVVEFLGDSGLLPRQGIRIDDISLVAELTAVRLCELQEARPGDSAEYLAYIAYGAWEGSIGAECIR